MDALNHSLKLQETEYEAKIQASIEEKKAAVQSASIDLEKQLHEKENELIALKGQIEKVIQKSSWQCSRQSQKQMKKEF